MKDFAREQINYLKAKFAWWFYSFFPSVKGKNTTMINVLLFCIAILVVLLLFNPDLEDSKRILMVIIILIAGVTIFILLYETPRDFEPSVHMRSPYAPYTPYQSTSPFNPRVEESSKRLLRETSEQIESQSKGFIKKQGFMYDSGLGAKDSTIRRRQEYSRREEVSPYGRTAGYVQNNQSVPNIQTSVFQAFNQPQSANRSTLSSRNVKDVPIPTSFGGGYRSGSPAKLNETVRYNYHMYDTNPRKNSEYAYSSSPMRGTANVRGYGKGNYIGGKALIDEQFGRMTRDTSYRSEVEKKADDLLGKFGIHIEFNDWKRNCQRWFTAKLIPKILDGNFTNIKELNKIIGFFDKRLHEYDFILKLEQGRTTENITQKPTSSLINMISIDELLNYETSFRAGGPLWPCSQLSEYDKNRAHQDLIHLVQTRRQLERYFEISGFRTFEVRTYILERLFRLREQSNLQSLQYNIDSIKRRYPTDTEILSNVFFTFLNIEAAIQTDDKEQIYRNFVFKSNTNTIPSNIGNEDVYFRQSNLEGNEPHYDIISGKEIWPAQPGKENLVAAIVLFVWHIKTKKHGTLGFEDSRTFKEFIQTVIP